MKCLSPKRENTIIEEVNGKQVRVLEQHGRHLKYSTEKRHIFIIGSKGIPAQYGGVWTILEKETGGRG